MKLIALLSLVLLLGTSCGSWKKGHHGGKHHFEMMDTNKDGKVSKSEWQKGHMEKFKKMDANKDGFVTMEEMQACRKKCKGGKCDLKKKGDCKDCKTDKHHHHGDHMKKDCKLCKDKEV